MRTTVFGCFLIAIISVDCSDAKADTAFISIGESNILNDDDSGNGNLLFAQQATLSQAATIQSLSFYVTVPAGVLRLGVYDATGPSGGPGLKVAETNEIVPSTGWNTSNVILPVALPAGTYWLAYFPSDNNLSFKVDRSSGTFQYYALNYGPMPPVFATSVNTGAAHWSFFATLAVGSPPPPPGVYTLPPDRATSWQPGVTYSGGIPNRTAVCASIQASTYGNGTQDATAGIQAALDACSPGQVVLLSAGTFLINADILYIRGSITLRGAGAGSTFVKRTNGAIDGVNGTGVAMPVIIVGQSRWTYGPSSVNLTADGVKGTNSVTVDRTTGLSAGMLVLVDELSGAGWRPDPQGFGRQVWAAADWRTVYRMHLPYVTYADDSDGSDATGPYDVDPATGAIIRPPGSMSWFSRQDRPTAEIHEISAVSGNVVTFTTPLHITYRGSHSAQLTYLAYPAVRGAGIERMTVTGGDDGDIRFVNAVSSWAKNIEVTTWSGDGFALDSSHRIEVRDSYIHDAAFSEPGGGAYAISLSNGSSESLIENDIVVRANKVITSRCSGAGSVVGYNYMDEGFINSVPAWQEMGLGGSHMVGPHHMLFEGNYSFNGDNDHTHGSSNYHTYFRNHLSGYRAAFTTNTGIAINDMTNVPGPDNGPRRAAGASAFSYWMSFVGNVLGLPGLPGSRSGWRYEANSADDAIWAIGWEDATSLFNPDPNVAMSLLRDGNYDFLTNSVHWHGIGGGGSTPATLPDSWYMQGRPAFFGSNPWPWVTPDLATQVHTLPAKARYDAGTPNIVP